MKKITKIMAIVLVLALCISNTPVSVSDAKSKNIYFSGEYKRKLGGGDYYLIELNKYSSPEGKEIGNYRVSYYSSVSGGDHDWGGSGLKKIGTNLYKGKRFVFKIYKNKLVLKKAGALSGTYKLKKRYPRS